VVFGEKLFTDCSQRIPEAARLIYVTPSHQFPIGTPMSLQRRTALLAWAAKRNAVIIEDDYDSEFRFGGRPLDPLQNMDRGGRVIYVGSFSKVMLPTLRLGFLIAPASLQAALRTAKQLTDWRGELPIQAALARFIDEGLLARHIRKAMREYATRHARIAEAIQRNFDAWLRLIPSAAGLHVAAIKAPGVSLDLARVVKHAEAWGVLVRTLADFSAETPAQEGIVIGYGAIPTAKVDEGLKRLARSLRAR
jgi:GntR family transcriptional regulator / MocR family aminotransferase